MKVKEKKLPSSYYLILFFLTALSISFFWNYKKNDQQKVFTNVSSHINLFSAKQQAAINKISPQMSVGDAASLAKVICSETKGSRFRDNKHCYSELFYFITSVTNQKFAFGTISELRKSNESFGTCHLIAHGIGRGMFDKDPKNWREIISKASPDCSYGEIHGILERYSSLGNDPFDKKNLPGICINNSNWACYHGLGHVILVQTSNDLYKAADLCYVFKTDTPKSSCLNGVFMEHMIGQSLQEHGLVSSDRRKYFYDHLDEFRSMCASQKNPDFIRACWTEIIHASVIKLQGNAEEVYAICAMAQTPEGEKDCRRHALAELVSVNNFDPFKSKYICTLPVTNDPNFERDCYRSIAGIILSNAPGKVESVVSFCSSLDPVFESGCSNVVKKEADFLNISGF